VDAAYVTGTVLVTNGVYANGGKTITSSYSGVSLGNRVAIMKQINLKSVNGPAVTTIQGYQVPGTINGNRAVRCVYLTAGTSLNGFTLKGGATGFAGQGFDYSKVQSGGGVYSESGDIIISNCVLMGNSAYVAAGGAYSGTLKGCLLVGNSVQAGEGGGATATLENCILIGNSAIDGGGAAWSTLNNCVLISNTAAIDGGGVSGCTLNNCIAFYNNAPSGANYDFAFGPCTLNYCSTTPLPPIGVMNITNDPLFVNASGGNYHLQSNSPCINSGNNSYVIDTTDFDGNPRIVGGTVDIGAYEYQTPTSIISYAWLQQYGLATDGSADYADADGTGMNNWQKWIAGLNPTNPASVLALQSPSMTATNATITWQSVAGINYFIQRGGDLGVQSSFLTIQSNIVGQAGMTSYVDTNTVSGEPLFYRVGVQH
jgi:hypothetical protein